MMSTLNPHDDRDALSALFDGELQGDAARFALKRLAHDPQWRESFSRWQLAGDAMRGHAIAAAPLDFADGVAARLARESAAYGAADAVLGTHTHHDCHGLVHVHVSSSIRDRRTPFR